jgi:FKBP-type peptidyl-prolyl cis-trans isomerase 2
VPPGFSFLPGIKENSMIKSGSKVSIHYRLSVDGALIDSSEEREPLTYVQGAEQIFPGVEEHLEGMGVGEETKLSIPAEEGYGPRDPEAVRMVPKSAFDDPEKLKVGMAVQGQAQEGKSFNAIVTAVSAEEVTLDLNHPLAGKTLDFELKVVEVN